VYKIKKSESIENLAKSLSKFQSEVTNPTNTATNPFFKSKYAPLSEVLNTVRPLLSKNGLSVMQSTTARNEMVIITTMLIHDSGEWIQFSSLPLKPEKNNPQGVGSAITYGRRYTLSAVLGISSEDDDDGNTASGNVENKKQKTESKKKTAAETKKDTELKDIIKKIDTLALTKSKTNREETVKAIKAHHTEVNYNTIKDIEVAKKVLEELQKIK